VHYYADGGWDDFKGRFDSVEEASANGIAYGEDAHWHVVDMETDKIVARDEERAEWSIGRADELGRLINHGVKP
jgi:hypothetical protein